MGGRQRKSAGKKSTGQSSTTTTNDKDFGTKLQQNNIIYTAFDARAADDAVKIRELLDQPRASEPPNQLAYNRYLVLTEDYENELAVEISAYPLLSKRTAEREVSGYFQKPIPLEPQQLSVPTVTEPREDVDFNARAHRKTRARIRHAVAVAVEGPREVVDNSKSRKTWKRNSRWRLWLGKFFPALDKDQDSERRRYEHLQNRGQGHPNILKYFGRSPPECELLRSGLLLEYHLRGTHSACFGKLDAIGVPETERRCWPYQAVSAVDYIHSRGVVHGDIGVHNFLVHDDGRLILCDFARSILYELDRGKRLFEGQSSRDIYRHLRDREFPDLSMVALPLRCIVKKCWKLPGYKARDALAELGLVRSAGESGEQGQSLIRRRWGSVAIHEVEGRSVTALWLSCAKISDKSDIDGALR
ncbi:uncharacterized protein LY89DRAFT_725897 [Mollisia scopiformis]|uniref:Protein kinase domain-containing protein n=1 Tax=Mollisia scopiformis TaxID=149040 RepID=A0A132B4Z6_MOLSC|nr:uncharacterized protein LY89DRAFT_725897 [Mollisia scopiformis]KUJ07411.1 hypothetical protein LY89DRAFT_725897 [Mollisia scopiformis]